MDFKFGTKEEMLGRLSKAVDDDPNIGSVSLEAFASKIANKTLTARQFVSSLIVSVENSLIEKTDKKIWRGYYEKIIIEFIQGEAELSAAYQFLNDAYRRA